MCIGLNLSIFDYGILESVITYVSLEEAQSRSSWSADDLIFMCERGQLECRRVGRDWFIAEGALARLADPASRQLLRARVGEVKDEISRARQQSRERNNNLKMYRALVAVALLMLVGSGTSLALPLTYAWWPKIEQRLAVLMDWSIDWPGVPLSSGVAAAAGAVGSVAATATETVVSGAVEELDQAQSFWSTLPERWRLIRLRVAANWRKFLGVEGVASPSGSHLAGGGVFAATTTAEIERYITDQISAQLQVLAKQAGGSSSAGSSPSTGVVLAPSSGSLETDAAILARIQSTFSDQVRLEVDQTGTGGVITPIFSRPTADRYLFLITPVRR